MFNVNNDWNRHEVFRWSFAEDLALFGMLLEPLRNLQPVDSAPLRAKSWRKDYVVRLS